MTKDKNLGQRGLLAAQGYIDRSSMTVLAVSHRTPAGIIPILAMDGDELVRFDVKVVPLGQTYKDKTPAASTFTKYRKQMEYALKDMGFDLPFRFDRVIIRQIAKDRAFLRHHRDIRPETQEVEDGSEGS